MIAVLQKMIWIVYFCLILCVSGLSNDEIGSTTLSDDDYCEEINCVGVEYSCIDRKCYCADGYIPNYSHVKCVKCPGLGDRCYGRCCSDSTRNYANETLQCWQGVCRQCYDIYGNWICRESLKEILLISSAQIAMGTALVLGIIATFILLYKLCSTRTLSPIGSRPNNPRLSVGSLQLYIEERLRDAPPRYTRATAMGVPVHPSTIYLNNGFVHDSSVPPPPYSPEDKTEEQRNATLHI